MQQCQRRIRQIKQQAVQKTRGTETLEQQLPDLQGTVAELSDVCGLAGNKINRFSYKQGVFLPVFTQSLVSFVVSAAEENAAAEREERYQEILERKNWKEAAISQEEELLFLREEVERLTRRNFVSLDELKYD